MKTFINVVVYVKGSIHFIDNIEYQRVGCQLFGCVSQLAISVGFQNYIFYTKFSI